MSGPITRPFRAAGLHVTVSMIVTSAPELLQFDGFTTFVTPPNQTGVVTNISGKSNSVRLYNAGPGTVFFELVGTQGDRTVVAGTGTPLAPGAPPEKFNTSGATWIAAVTTPGDTATLYATPGEGGV